MHSHGCEHRLWADDAQIYVHLQPDLSSNLQTPFILLPPRHLDALDASRQPPPQLYQSELMVSLPLSQCP